MAYEFRLRRSFPSSASENDAAWSGFTPAEIDILDRERIPSQYAPGDAIFRQDDAPSGILCIEEGYVLMSRIDAAGIETTFGIFGPHETIGHRSFFASDVHVATARAISPCSVYLIPPNTVRRLIESNTELAWWFLRTTASDRGPSDGLLLRGNKVPARVRLIRLLLILRDNFGRIDAAGRFIIELPLSRGEIANMVGVTPETVTRTIREIEDENLAEFHGRKVIVPRPDELEIAGEPDF